jgi:hypothetical protein
MEDIVKKTKKIFKLKVQPPSMIDKVGFRVVPTEEDEIPVCEPISSKKVEEKPI